MLAITADGLRVACEPMERTVFSGPATIRQAVN